MAEMEGMVHRELKVTTIICIFEGTAFERYYFNVCCKFPAQRRQFSAQRLLLDYVM